jgi:outer membrane protein OmpA-like peptidoglycan-associated protein
MSLALFAAPAFAQEEAPAQEQPSVEQPAVEEAAPQIPEEVLALLNDTRPLSELSAEELGARAKQARNFSKMKGLPQDVREQLQNVAQAARGEIAAREELAAQPAAPAAEQPAEAPVEQKVETPVEQPAEQPAEAAAPEPAEIPPDVANLLNDQRPLGELSDDELANRFKLARQFAKAKKLPGETKAQLAEIVKAVRAEMLAREQAAQKVPEPLAPSETAEQPPVVEQPAVTEAPQAMEVPADVAALLNDQRPLSELTAEELAARLKAARQFSKDSNLPEETRGKLAEIAQATRGELMAREQQAGQKTPEATTQVDVVPPPPPAVIEQAPTAPLPPAPPAVVEAPVQTLEPAPPPAPAVDAKQAQKLDGNPGTPEAEAKAKVILDDARTADKLTDAELKARVDSIRDLMAGNELSRATEKALRQKLRVEREILRDRVAAAEAKEPKPGQPPAPAKPPKDDKYIINIEIVLNDRRPSEELELYELRRRLEVYRQAAYDQQYEAQQRAYWRAVMERDQYYLQQRMLRERREREAALAAQYGDDEFDIEIGVDYDPDQGDVYEAEVDDEELEHVLVAPPRKKPARRYSVQEVEASAELREALPRIEIDTVHFGFNEAFVRAEEVGNLDRIAEVMERILSKHPREKFLIEGHTDAVGSDASNLALSRQRAAAIKKALTTYYVISARNLETVGYGERYLKIPTAEAEQENRRVSVSRATAVIGELEE